MSVKIDSSGRRSVQVEVEVPGTPEEVWQAIATGKGVSSWFVPTKGEERVGGTFTADFGPGMESVSTITSWEPPHRFTADSADLGPDKPNIATEWSVEARAGGTCIVRVVHSLFTTSDEWDDQLHQWEGGWPGFFRILRLYLTHFRTQIASTQQFVGMAAGSAQETWDAATGSLGLAGAKVGDRRTSPAGAPTLSAIVESAGVPEFPHELLLRLDAPTPGIAHLFAMPMAGPVLVLVRLYLFGDTAPAVLARVEPEWQAWMAKLFPAPDPSHVS